MRATDEFLKEGAQERRRALLEEMLASADRGSMSWDDAAAEVGRAVHPAQGQRQASHAYACSPGGMP